MQRSSIWMWIFALSILGLWEAWGWGGTAHRLINQKATTHLPSSMAQLSAQQAFLASHASDADTRRSVDTAESPKHYLDIEQYPDYQHLSPDLSSLVSQYGWSFVKETGILPWATVWALDSLTEQLRRSDWNKAYQTAADLGHYVADAHQPLHCTVNYDGGLTGNNGIHSRYESEMINRYQASLTVVPDTVQYVSDPFSSALAYVLRSNAYVPAILQADNDAKTVSQWNGQGQAPAAYFAVLWERSRALTTTLIQDATRNLAWLWYTAWVNAGLTRVVAVNTSKGAPDGAVLAQNYPNPFNTNSEIRYQISEFRYVRLAVYDVLGREVTVLVNEKKEPGSYAVTFDARGLASGVYSCRLQATEIDGRRLDSSSGEPGAFVLTKKMLLLN